LLVGYHGAEHFVVECAVPIGAAPGSASADPVNWRITSLIRIAGNLPERQVRRVLEISQSQHHNVRI